MPNLVVGTPEALDAQQRDIEEQKHEREEEPKDKVGGTSTRCYAEEKKRRNKELDFHGIVESP